MKKVLFIAALFLVCFSMSINAQTKKEERAAKREALKKEREARRAIEAQMDSVAYLKAVSALEEGEFVLEANNVTFPNGLVRFVSSNTNYVQVDNGEGVVQTAFSNFTYRPGPNGLGGVTVEGEKVTDIGQKFTKEELSGEGKIVKKGKKSFNRIISK